MYFLSEYQVVYTITDKCLFYETYKANGWFALILILVYSYFVFQEKREAAVDPSNEILTLQTELGEARMREAELTISFEELQHRITAIDRLIETVSYMIIVHIIL